MQTQTINTTRVYPVTNPREEENDTIELKYTIKLENGRVKEVINQSGYACNLNSEVHAYYSSIYNNI